MRRQRERQAKTNNRSTSAQKLVGLTCTCASLFAFGADECRGDESAGADKMANEQSKTFMPAIRVYVFET